MYSKELMHYLIQYQGNDSHEKKVEKKETTTKEKKFGLCGKILAAITLTCMH